MAERETRLETEPFIGPETLADFTRGLKEVAGLRRHLLDALQRKNDKVAALQSDLARASTYIDVLKGAFEVCPPIMASTDFRVMQMSVLDECSRNAGEWKDEIASKVAAAQASCDEITSNLYDMNEAVRLANVAMPGSSDVVQALLQMPEPSADDVRAAVQAIADNAALTATKQTCPICWERASTHACVPCGHMFCEKCARTLLLCAACRGAVKSAMKIYF